MATIGYIYCQGCGSYHYSDSTGACPVLQDYVNLPYLIEGYVEFTGTEGKAAKIARKLRELADLLEE